MDSPTYRWRLAKETCIKSGPNNEHFRKCYTRCQFSLFAGEACILSDLENGVRTRMIRKLLPLAFLLLICLGAGAAYEVTSCHNMNVPPRGPVYPNSTLTDQVLRGVGTSNVPLATFYYVATDAPETLVSFFKKSGDCREGVEPIKREVCEGDAVPYGQYSVYIDLDAYPSKAVTSYVVELRWTGCTNKLE